MQATVQKNILDDSITGEKIFSGIIDYVNGIVTDSLVLPHPGGSAWGSINGDGFSIGYANKIQYMGAQEIVLKNDGGYDASFKAVNSGGVSVLEMMLVSGEGEFHLRSSAGDSKIKLASGGLTYFDVPRVLIGMTSELYPGAKLQINGTVHAATVKGTSGVIGTLSTTTMSFLDGGTPIYVPAWYTEYKAVKVKTDSYAPNLGSLTSAIVSQLINIGGLTITSGSWSKLSTLDQEVKTTSSVQHATLSVNTAGLTVGSRTPSDSVWEGLSATTWTQILSNKITNLDGATISNANLYYKRIGNDIYVNIYFAFSSKLGTPNNSFKIELPFEPIGMTTGDGIAPLVLYDGTQSKYLPGAITWPGSGNIFDLLGTGEPGMLIGSVVANFVYRKVP